MENSSRPAVSGNDTVENSHMVEIDISKVDQNTNSVIGNDASSKNAASSSDNPATTVRVGRNIFKDDEFMEPEKAQEQYTQAIKQQSETNKKIGGFAKRITNKVKKIVKDGLTSAEGVSVPKQVLQQPQIMLEVISGRVAGFIIIITYFVFALSFGLDTWSTLKNLKQNESKSILLESCAAMKTQPKNLSLINTLETWGCLDTTHFAWSAVYTDVYDVISVSLNMADSNFTLPEHKQNDLKSSIFIEYNVQLWACFQPLGCAKNFDSDDTNDLGQNWLFVLGMNNQRNPLLLSSGTLNGYDVKTSDFQFFSIFQNQEAIPTDSRIRSYYVKVTFLDPYTKEALLYDTQGQPSTRFNLLWDHRESGPYNDISTFIQMLLFIGTVVFSISFVVIVNRYHTARNKRWLVEQKWFLVYAVSVMLCQNPVYLVQNVTKSDASSALVAYICFFLAQSLLIIVWLFFADSINQYSKHWTWFYLPKIGYGLLMFLASAIMLGMQFPSFTIGNVRSQVLASFNWSDSDKSALIGASMLFLGLYLLWVVIWIVRLILTYRQLNTLSYMSTRYQQLLFRFFVLQASLVAIFFVAQYTIAVYYIGHKHLYDYDGDSFTDTINILFRQQLQMFGKTIFLSIYAGILGFLLLPAECMNSNIGEVFSQQFALTESEYAELVAQKMKSGAKEPVLYCVETALALLDVSWDTYGVGVTPAKEDMDKAISDLLLTHKYAFIESVVNAEYECLCVVARHIETKKLVLGYRGTQSKKNMSDNLNYRKQYIDFENMSMPELDATDGLDPLPPPVPKPLPSDTEDGKNRTFSWSNLTQAFSTDLFDRKKDTPLADADSGKNRSKSFASRSSFDLGFRKKSENRDSEPDSPESMSSKAKRLIPGQNFINAIATGGEYIVDAVASSGDKLDKLAGAAAATIGIDLKLLGIHRGFLGIYLSMRLGMHRILRRELKLCPADIYITGHSMGGACASLATLDLSINTIPRVKAYLESCRNAEKHEIKLTMYNFGSPRVGDRAFRKLYNKNCPYSFRTVVDGDLVTGVPKNMMGFKHACLQVLIDNDGAGNIIVDPSFVERWLRLRKGVSIKAHIMDSYKHSLDAVMRTTILVRKLSAKLAAADHGGNVDFVTLQAELVKDIMNIDASGRPTGDSLIHKNSPNASPAGDEDFTLDSLPDTEESRKSAFDVENPIHQSSIIADAPMTPIKESEHIRDQVPAKLKSNEHRIRAHTISNVGDGANRRKPLHPL